ncbi:MAG TPA: tRNA (adenosine(37)-N6)-threonylcarbamoyltransferase complex dimerization subunit type 1 TsaB [Gammaproteobacteria bacterium]
MKLLAIDTATERCSVALWVDGRIIQREQMLNRAHAEVILPMVNALLQEAGYALNQLDAVGFGRGPGGFTGVRVAVSVAQGLAFGAGLPVLPVSDLAAIAAGAFRLHGAQRVLVCMDARMGEVYWGAFSVMETAVQAHIEESVASPETIHAPDSGKWFGAGSGFLAYQSVLKDRLVNVLAGADPGLLPEARDVASLAAQAYGRGEYLPAEQALPVYLRDQVAWPKAAL